MKTRRIFWGVFFITAGVFFVLNNFNFLNLDWRFIFKLWPLIFIFWGITSLLKTQKTQTIRFIFIAVNAIAIAIFLFAGIKTGIRTSWVFIDNAWKFAEKGGAGRGVIQKFSEPYYQHIQHASLMVDTGAGRFVISDTTEQLLSAVTESSFGGYTLERYSKNGVEELTLKTKRQNFDWSKGNIKNKIALKLNPNPVWDIDLDIGAASVDFDLSLYKTGNIKIDTGATSVKVKLGAKSRETNLKIDAGASAIKILVPDSAGCELNVDTALSQEDFIGFEKLDSHKYQTGNFENSTKKIYIDIDAGVSTVKVVRYGVNEVEL